MSSTTFLRFLVNKSTMSRLRRIEPSYPSLFLRESSSDFSYALDIPNPCELFNPITDVTQIEITPFFSSNKRIHHRVGSLGLGTEFYLQGLCDGVSALESSYARLVNEKLNGKYTLSAEIKDCLGRKYQLTTEINGEHKTKEKEKKGGVKNLLMAMPLFGEVAVDGQIVLKLQQAVHDPLQELEDAETKLKELKESSDFRKLAAAKANSQDPDEVTRYEDDRKNFIANIINLMMTVNAIESDEIIVGPAKRSMGAILWEMLEKVDTEPTKTYRSMTGRT